MADEFDVGASQRAIPWCQMLVQVSLKPLFLDETRPHRSGEVRSQQPKVWNAVLTFAAIVWASVTTYTLCHVGGLD